MTPAEFRRQCEALGFSSTAEKAALFEVDLRTVLYWEKGKSRIPGAVKLILKLLREQPELRSRL